MDENLPPLLVIVGQTAVGKTALSLRLAELFNGEIVSADSRLFYRGMDIGTAKPSAAEQTAVSHQPDFVKMLNQERTWFQQSGRWPHVTRDLETLLSP